MVKTFLNNDLLHTLNEDDSVNSLCTENLPRLCADIFMLAIRIKRTENIIDPLDLRMMILFSLNILKTRCKQIDIADCDVNNTIYALVSLLDEIILSNPGVCRDYWMSNPLQLEIFGDIKAGENFYHRLVKLIAGPQKNEGILVVYYLCLSLGFEGKYKMSNREERIVLLNKLYMKIHHTQKYDFFPQNNKNVKENIIKKWNRASAWICFIFWVTLVLIIYCIVLLSINMSRIERVIKTLNQTYPEL